MTTTPEQARQSGVFFDALLDGALLKLKADAAQRHHPQEPREFLLALAAQGELLPRLEVAFGRFLSLGKVADISADRLYAAVISIRELSREEEARALEPHE